MIDAVTIELRAFALWRDQGKRLGERMPWELAERPPRRNLRVWRNLTSDTKAAWIEQARKQLEKETPR